VQEGGGVSLNHLAIAWMALLPFIDVCERLWDRYKTDYTEGDYVSDKWFSFGYCIPLNSQFPKFAYWQLRLPSYTVEQDYMSANALVLAVYQRVIWVFNGQWCIAHFRLHRFGEPA
jgi:hypothetical protein